MTCFFNFRPDEEKLKEFYSALQKESKHLQQILKCSDAVLSRIDEPKMVYQASECFHEAEKCMFTYLEAYNLARSPIIKEYCLLRYKEALDIRTVTSQYLPTISVDGRNKNSKILKNRLIEKLFEESKSEKYHLEDFYS